MSLQNIVLTAMGIFVGGSLVFGLITSFLLHPVLYWLYERVAPKNHVEATKVGERVEAVFHIDFWTTTFPWILNKWVLKLFLLNLLILFLSRSFLIQGRESFGGVLFYYLLLAAILIQAFLNSVALPFFILSIDWEKRIRVRAVATTTAITTYVLRSSLAGIITSDASLPYVSESDMRVAESELQWSGDPQDINPNIKTGFIHDQIIALRTSTTSWYGGGVRSAKLLSNVEQAADEVFLVKWGSTALKIIDICAQRADIIESRTNRLQEIKTDIEVGKLDQPYEEEKIQEKINEIDKRFKGKAWPSIEYNPFLVEDPKHWDLKTGKELVPYELKGDFSDENSK